MTYAPARRTVAVGALSASAGSAAAVVRTRSARGARAAWTGAGPCAYRRVLSGSTHAAAAAVPAPQTVSPTSQRSS